MRSIGSANNVQSHRSYLIEFERTMWLATLRCKSLCSNRTAVEHKLQAARAIGYPSQYSFIYIGGVRLNARN